MQVFKVYFKVIRNNRGQLIMYLMIFLLLTFMMSTFFTSSVPSQSASFSAVKPKAAIINMDEENPLLDGFRNFIAEHASMVDINADGDALKDALFFHTVEYAVRVPEGFTQAFLNGDDMALEAAGTPDSTQAVLLGELVDKYFSTAALYVKYGKSNDLHEIANLIRNDLNQAAPIQVSTKTPVMNTDGVHIYVFNYMSYSLFAVLILGVTTFMLSFNETDLKRRNLCAPLPIYNMNLQMFLANIVFGAVCWALLSGMAVVIYHKDMLSVKGIWLCLNSFAYMLSALGISFLLGSLIKKRSAQAPLQNTLTLAFSFLSGAFVPQAMLDKTVLSIASFTPNYWFIKNNHTISALRGFSIGEVSPILMNILIMFGFGAAALLTALAIAKKRAAGGVA